jgi:hypothetical protein
LTAEDAATYIVRSRITYKAIVGAAAAFNSRLDTSLNDDGARDEEFGKAFAEVLDIEVDGLRSKGEDDTDDEAEEDGDEGSEMILSSSQADMSGA